MKTADDDEKSGYTNAFRRAAQDAWGIGRYLYRKGIPAFLDPNARPFEETTQAPKVEPSQTSSRPSRTETTSNSREDESKSSTGASSANPSSTARGSQSSDRGIFVIPKARGLYSWVKAMEEHFATKIFNGVKQHCERNGWGTLFGELDADQTRASALDAIRFLREQPNYKGEFEHVFEGPDAAPVQAPEPSQAPSNTGVNVAALRRDLMQKIEALIFKQTGKEATNVEKKQAFQTIAANCKNSEGHEGEVPDTLSTLTDAVWLRNMITFVDKQIKEASALPPDEEIPF